MNPLLKAYHMDQYTHAHIYSKKHATIENSMYTQISIEHLAPFNCTNSLSGPIPVESREVTYER